MENASRAHPPPRSLARIGLDAVSALFADASEHGAFRLAQFFTAEIRNRHTRAAYALAVKRFAAWCDRKGHALDDRTDDQLSLDEIQNIQI
jgi:hypothetical protein